MPDPLLLAGPLTSVRAHGQQELGFLRSVLPSSHPSLLQSAHPKEVKQAVILLKLHCGPLPFLLILSQPTAPSLCKQSVCAVLGTGASSPSLPWLAAGHGQRMLGGHYFAAFTVLFSLCLRKIASSALLVRG